MGIPIVLRSADRAKFFAIASMCYRSVYVYLYPHIFAYISFYNIFSDNSWSLYNVVWHNSRMQAKWSMARVPKLMEKWQKKTWIPHTDVVPVSNFLSIPK